MHAWRRWLWAVWLALAAAAACLVIGAPLVPQWGQDHPPQARDRWQRLQSGERLEQTFALEYGRLDGLTFLVDPSHPLPSAGGIEVEVEVGNQRRQAFIPYERILADGLALVALSPPVDGRPSQAGVFRLHVRPDKQTIFLQFQNDSTLYPQGELAHSARYAQGDLAFHLHYQRPALGRRLWQWLYAAAMMTAAAFIAWVGWKFPSAPISIGKRDMLAAGAVASLVFAAYVWWLLSWPGSWVGPGDFVKDVSYLTASSQAFAHGAWPSWSHLICGGMPLLGNPESNTLSLATLLALVFDPEKSLWLLLAAEAGIGAAGVYTLGRVIGCSRLASILAAIVAIGSAAYPYRIVEGFSMIGGAVAFVPWALVGWWQAWKVPSWRWAGLSGLALAFTFWRGEVHILTAVLLMLGVSAMWAALTAQRARLAMVLTVIAVFFLAASPKVLAYLPEPGLFAHQYKPYVARLIADGLLTDVFLRVPSRFVPVDVRHGKFAEEWANFGSYIGWLPLAMAGAGLLSKRKQTGLVIAGVVISFVLAEGTFYDLGLRHFSFLAGLLRLPVRALSITIIFLGLLAGRGLDELRRFFRTPRAGLVVQIALVAAMALDLAAASSQVFAETLWQRTSWPAHVVSEPRLIAHVNQSSGDRLHAGTLLRQGYLLPRLCADVLSEPQFAKRLSAPVPLAPAPAGLAPGAIVLSPTADLPEYEVRSRFDSAWVSPDAWVLPGSAGQMRIVPFRQSGQVIRLLYIHGLARAEQMLLVATLVFAMLVVTMPEYARPRIQSATIAGR